MFLWVVGFQTLKATETPTTPKQSSSQQQCRPLLGEVSYGALAEPAQ